MWVPSLWIVTVSAHVVFHKEYNNKGNITVADETF